MFDPRKFAAIYLSLSVLVLSACAEDRTFRVSSVGSAKAAELAQAEATGANQSAPIVAAGNVLVGGSGQAGSAGWLGGATGSGGILNGSVATVLVDAGQTLVQLDSGTAVLLNGTGGNVGDAVSINLASGQVTAGPSGLIGTSGLTLNAGNIGGTGGSGTSLTSGVQAGSGLPVLSNPQTLTTGSTTSTVTNTINGLLQPRCC